MSSLPAEVRDAVAGWLSSGEVEVFIGWVTGTVPLRAAPAFIRRAEDVERLIWDATCENNLAVYLPDLRGKKVGLMVKGCDSRAVVGLLQEGQVVREDLRLVGVRCTGVIDPREVAARLGLSVEDMDQGTLEGERVVVRGHELPVSQALYDMCQVCAQRTPSISDICFGDGGDDVQVDGPYAHVHEIEALAEDERWERFVAELARCNLCYACRNACPLCYCNTCFADRTMPKWVNPTAAPEDVQFFQIMRTFHLAGRCVGCGACTRACPQGVDLRLFLDKLRLDVATLYGYEAGTDPEAIPPLRVYRSEDYNDFILAGE